MSQILAFSALFAQAAPFMIIGNDEKLINDEARNGERVGAGL